MKLTTTQAKELLPKTVRMTYGFKDVLMSALEVGEEYEIGCDDLGKAEYIAVYKLVRVEPTGRK
jgi:hypothetical protein